MVATILVKEQGISWMLAPEPLNEIGNIQIGQCEMVGGIVGMLRLALKEHAGLSGWCSGCCELGVRRVVKIEVASGNMPGSSVRVGSIEGDENLCLVG